jgi:hypothetical protein
MNERHCCPLEDKKSTHVTRCGRLLHQRELYAYQSHPEFHSANSTDAEASGVRHIPFPVDGNIDFVVNVL